MVFNITHQHFIWNQNVSLTVAIVLPLSLNLEWKIGCVVNSHVSNSKKSCGCKLLGTFLPICARMVREGRDPTLLVSQDPPQCLEYSGGFLLGFLLDWGSEDPVGIFLWNLYKSEKVELGKAENKMNLGPFVLSSEMRVVFFFPLQQV